MAAVVAEAGVPVCLMHMLGEPKTMQQDPHYEDVVSEVAAFLGERIGFARSSGIAPDLICVDPGIGFGKTAEHNLDPPAPPRPAGRASARSFGGSLAQVVPRPPDGRARGGP